MSQPVWSASMITPLQDLDAPLFRTEITIDRDHGDVVSARWLVSAQGVFQAYLGGSPVDDDVLSPGWSSYEWRVRYRDYDVTDAIAAADGPVVLGVAVGNGWYRGRLTWKGIRNIYARARRSDRPARDHLRRRAPPDSGHRPDLEPPARRAVVANDIYDGETIDARLVVGRSWLQPGFGGVDDWAGVHVVDFDIARAHAVRRTAGRPARTDRAGRRSGPHRPVTH